MLTPREKSSRPEAQRKFEPATLYHTRQWAQHTTELFRPPSMDHKLKNLWLAAQLAWKGKCHCNVCTERSWRRTRSTRWWVTCLNSNPRRKQSHRLPMTTSNRQQQTTPPLLMVNFLNFGACLWVSLSLSLFGLHCLIVLYIYTYICVCVCVSVCVCVCVSVCVYGQVCLRGREREREREHLCMYVCM